MLEKGALVIRADEEFIPSLTEVFKVIKVRDNNRYDLRSVDFIGLTIYPNRIWHDISEEHLKLLLVGDLK